MADQERDFLGQIDIVALISEYVTLRRHGREYQGLCPFHSERTPSFSVNPEKGFWYCHGCHEGGDKVSFIAKIEGIGRGQAIRALAERQGIALSGAPGRSSAQDEVLRERLLAACAASARFYEEQLAAEDALPARTYLRSRGIDRSCAGDFGLGFAPTSYDSLYRRLLGLGFNLQEMEDAGLCAQGDFGPYDRMRQRLIIPVADGQGRVIAFGGRAIGDASPKYLNSPETALFHKSRTLYLLHRARKAIQKVGSAIIVEGYMDALMAHHYGIQNVVATLGTAITPQHIQALRRLASRLLFALDSDEAGIRAVEKSAAMASEAGMEVAVVSLPAGMDPDTFLRQSGPDQFRETLQRAVGVVEFRLASILKQHDLHTTEGKTKAIQECTKVLAGVRSEMLRDRYVDDLARLWSGSQARGEDLLDVMEVIRADISSQVRRNLGSQRRSVSHRLAETENSLPAMETDQERAEAKLLAALIGFPDMAGNCREIVEPADFRSPDHRKVYESILQYGAPEDWPLSTEDDGLVSITARLVSQAPSIVNPEGTIVDCARKVKDFERRLRLEELRKRMESSSVGPDELQEFYNLSRYFKPGLLE